MIKPLVACPNCKQIGYALILDKIEEIYTQVKLRVYYKRECIYCRCTWDEYHGTVSG